MITEILLETLVDNLKIFPFLFAAYFFMEWLEQKTSENATNFIRKAGKTGPFFGALFGILPQCGFSAVAANFYAVKIITIGTLIAVLLSTSDEMLPIFISQAVSPLLITKILLYKFFYGCIIGFCLDFILRKRNQNTKPDIEAFCKSENCSCEKSIFVSALYHSLSIALFIFIITLLMSITVSCFSDNKALLKILQKPVIGEIFGALLGLIPNCSASVILTQLYLDNFINIGTLMSGSLSGSGVGLLILFRVNKNVKQNIKITAFICLLGIIGGLIAELINL